MKKISSYKKLFVLLGVSLLGGLLFEYFVGLPQYVEGKLVTRQTEWMPIPALPISIMQKNIYYVYSDETGKEVKHGPFRLFERWCGGIYQACYSYGSYLDGMKEDTWLSVDGNGEKTHETFYLNDRAIGRADYHDGELIAYARTLYQHGYPIGVVQYQPTRNPDRDTKGIWIYQLNCNGRKSIHQTASLESKYEKCTVSP